MYIMVLFVVEITVTGPVGEHGMIMNQTLLDKIVNDSIISLLDHKFIDESLEFFKANRRYMIYDTDIIAQQRIC
jgi:6-pyruvoyl-tetrahydropterin synthase